ncbi:hypothetical protein EEL33_01175 [Muribaculaceae bacterium Isolate-037 (Harlan)]|nr:hypothetical protein EEL33_01175 [Muribaculaceae bacterium Isolate-037 (Harlan)]
MEKSVEIVECGRQPTGKRLVVIILKREQLLYDIKNYCYIEGDIMPEDTQHSRHMVQDVGEEGNVDRVIRILSLAHADVVERLYPFTQHEIHHPVVDDRLREKPVYGIFLNVPETYSQTTLNLLGGLIHELMVCIAIADWMSITNPPKEETWKRKAEATLTRINQVKSQTRDRSRIRPHWL